jgi:uncharacterized protein YpmS
VLLGVALAATQAEQRGWEGLTIETWAVWVLLARNIILLAVFLLLVLELRDPGRPSQAPRVMRDL